jgi:hypothetical protein
MILGSSPGRKPAQRGKPVKFLFNVTDVDS